MLPPAGMVMLFLYPPSTMLSSFPVWASVNVMMTSALIACSARLLTLTVNSIRSDSRRNLGDAGSTIIFLRVIRVVSILPVLSESVNVIPCTLHSVSSCGARKCTLANPSESVTRYSNRPVGLRSVLNAIPFWSWAALSDNSSPKAALLKTTSSPAACPARRSSTSGEASKSTTGSSMPSSIPVRMLMTDSSVKTLAFFNLPVERVLTATE